MQLQEIQAKIQNAKALDFGTVFNQCIVLFKKVWVNGLVVLLLNFVLIIPLMLIVYLPMIFLGILSPESFERGAEPNVFVIVISIVLAILFLTAIIAVSLALKAAYYRILRNKDLNLNQKEDYFYYLKKNYLVKTTLIGLVIMAISILATLLLVLPLIYVIVPLYFIMVVYAFNPDLSVSEILKAAFSLGNKKWLLTFGLIVVAYFLSAIVGFLMCFVGIYVTQQFLDIPAYQVYKETVGFDETDEIAQIGNE